MKRLQVRKGGGEKKDIKIHRVRIVKENGRGKERKSGGDRGCGEQKIALVFLSLGA